MTITESDLKKIPLKIDYFRRRSAATVGVRDLPRTLLLETIAAMDACGGALYIHESEQLHVYGKIQNQPALRRRMKSLMNTANAAPGKLVLDGDDKLFAPLWCRGQLHGVLYVIERQFDDEIGAFTSFDKTLFIALAATASMIFEKAFVEEENRQLQAQGRGEGFVSTEMIGSSPALQHILSQIDLIANLEISASILIQGESGTGKELIAKAIHEQGQRRNKRLVTVNCAAIPNDLLESELFGHEKGAFTGAFAQKRGKFELANGGTIFLDEIGDMPAQLQVKLLRVLEDGSFSRVGSNEVLNSDFMLISATNRNLKEDIETERFRHDLYYRLCAFEINVPPLRERIEDIPDLARYFLHELNSKNRKKQTISISPDALHSLREYDWPGNIRQLKQVVERAYIFCEGNTIQPHHMPAEIGKEHGSGSLVFSQIIPLEEAIARYIRFAFNNLGGHKTKTMKVLGIEFRRLQRYLGKSQE